MKVLLLSTPRSYSKSIQSFIAGALPAGEEQSQLFSPNGDSYGHLNDILGFNEARVIGWEESSGVWRPSRLPYTKTIRHFAPQIRDTHVGFEPVDRMGTVKQSQILELVERLLALDSWILRLNPHIFYEQFLWPQGKCTEVLKRLVKGADTVLSVMRIDIVAQHNSTSSAAMYGWTEKDRLPDAYKIIATKTEANTYMVRERYLRAVCAAFDITPTWSESWARNPHKLLEHTTGLKTSLNFPVEEGYSKLGIAPKNSTFMKCACDSTPLSLRQELSKIPEYARVLAAKNMSMIRAAGYMGEAQGDAGSIWASEDAFNKWSIEIGDIFNDALNAIKTEYTKRNIG
jgi:hypothetical protein